MAPCRPAGDGQPLDTERTAVQTPLDTQTGPQTFRAETGHGQTSGAVSVNPSNSPKGDNQATPRRCRAPSSAISVSSPKSLARMAITSLAAKRRLRPRPVRSRTTPRFCRWFNAWFGRQHPGTAGRDSLPVRGVAERSRKPEPKDRRIESGRNRIPTPSHTPGQKHDRTGHPAIQRHRPASAHHRSSTTFPPSWRNQGPHDVQTNMPRAGRNPKPSLPADEIAATLSPAPRT